MEKKKDGVFIVGLDDVMGVEGAAVVDSKPVTGNGGGFVRDDGSVTWDDAEMGKKAEGAFMAMMDERKAAEGKGEDLERVVEDARTLFDDGGVLVPSEPDMLRFWDFFSCGFVPMQKLSLPLKPEHRVLCEELEIAVTVGRDGIEYYVINIPPRFGKTKILEALACWMWTINSGAQMIYTGVTVDLVSSSMRYIAGVIQSDWYQMLFPWVKVGAICRSDQVTSDGGGNVYGAGIGGTIIGKGAGLKYKGGGYLAIDDASKPNEALSQTVADGVIAWFESGPTKRRNSVDTTPIIVCSQRLGEDDLPGYLLKNYRKQTRLIKFPALRKDGTSIMEETVSAVKLESWKNSPIKQVQFDFWSQYMQEPIPAGGNMIPVGSFLRYNPFSGGEVGYGSGWERRVISCDTALKTKEHNDYSVFQIWGKRGNKVFLIDQMRGKWESPELLANAVTFWKKHTLMSEDGHVHSRPKFIVEEKAAGTGLVQQLRRVGVPVTGVERNIDKVTRTREMLPFIESGMVVIPRDDDYPWVRDFTGELSAFRADGNAKHDDQNDCAVDAILELLGKPPSIFDMLG